MRENTLVFSDSVAITIIAGLLSLLPVVILMWIYYVRERKPSVTGVEMTRFFAVGILSAGIAVLLERGAYISWSRVLPSYAGAFFAENISFADVRSIGFAVLISFGIIALIEEGVRYVLLRYVMSKKVVIDQMIDGIQYGFAMGLGFAFVENTIYFLQLFRRFDFDTLVVVFFLRFLISTIGHLVFGGVMGYCLALALGHPVEQRRFVRRAFFIPWLMHGAFDFLLAIQLSFYTVLLLAIPLLVFWSWWHDERLFEVHVFHGRRLRFPMRSSSRKSLLRQKRAVEVLPQMRACPNCYVPITEQDTLCPSCGVHLLRKRIPKRFPFLPSAVS